MKRYVEIYWLMIRNSLIREMSFKANFILWMVVEFLWFVGQIIFLEVLFGHTDRIGDWSKWECVLLVGTHQITAQLFQAFFYVNLSELPELIRTGRLYLMMVQPMDAQIAVSTRRFGMDNVVNALVGVAIVIFSLVHLGTQPGPIQIGLFAVAIGLGIAIHYAVLFFLATVAFWIVRAQGLIYGYYNVFNIARYPDVVFRGVFRMIFSYLIPVILVANVPARTIARAFESPWSGLAQLTGATIFVVLATRAFWKFALRHYASASS
ncbi:MAG: hypothetical protein JWQ44_1275 [Chthoniobacter sp.]|nr:hypothetical protein [Chthoniobacter sp.]